MTNGEDWLFFAGTAYLDIPNNEDFRKLVFAGMERYGTNYGASRHNYSVPDVFGKAEAVAAKNFGSEDSIIVSSGYLAAQLVLQYFMNDYELIYAPETHPALWIGPPRPPKVSFNNWVDSTLLSANNAEKPVMIITNSLNNLTPEIYDFSWVTNLRPTQKIVLLVDDSHGIGVTGDAGQGVYGKIPVNDKVEVIVIASMAKALGIDAGMILSSQKTINKLRNSPIYAGASPPSPGFLFAYANGARVYEQELERVRSNLKFFMGLLNGVKGLKYVENFPVVLIDNPQSGDLLLKQGFLISSFAYPDPKGQPLNRVVINSGHTNEELRKLATAIAKISR